MTILSLILGLIGMLFLCFPILIGIIILVLICVETQKSEGDK